MPAPSLSAPSFLSERHPTMPSMDDANARVGLLAAAAISLFIDAVDQSPPESWDQPSNLDDWSLRDLVGHATGSVAKIVALVAGEENWDGPSRPADWIAKDPVARLRELAVRLQDVLPGADMAATRVSPQGEVPLYRALAFPVSDVVLHSWDVHRSQGRLVELPADLFDFCRGLVESVPESMLRRPGAFGPARSVPDGATPSTQLMAYLGRCVDGPDRG